MSGTAIKLTKSDWEKLDTRWQEVDEKTRLWLLKLDASLPGRLGEFGRWLYKAESLLLREAKLLTNPHDNIPQLQEVIREHKVMIVCVSIVFYYHYCVSAHTSKVIAYQST